MSKSIIRYATHGSLEKIMEAASAKFEKSLSDTTIDEGRLEVDKSTGLARLKLISTMSRVSRFFWIADDSRLTGDIQTIEDRRQVIKTLHDKGLIQTEIADFLGISQSLISKDLIAIGQ